MKKFIFAVLLISIGIAIGFLVQPANVKQGYTTAVFEGEKEASMTIVAVNEDNVGVSSILTVKIRPGSGLVLVNIGDVLADYNTQYSARIAAKVASDVTQIDLSNVDVIYTIDADATAIEGSSAGSAMAIATIAALQGKELRKDVMITGNINEQGGVEQAGAIREKAQAAYDAGATLFLVPEGHSIQATTFVEDKVCSTYKGFEYCEINYKGKPSISAHADIQIAEVSTVEEALKYFYDEN